MKALTGSFYKLFLLVFISVAISSCISDYDENKQPPSKTLFIYMAANNSLIDYMNDNLFGMKQDMAGLDDEAFNVVVFVERKKYATEKVKPDPVLLRIHDGKFDTICTFSNMNACDPVVLKEMIGYVTDKWKSDSYGLVFWSHGTGWVPTSQLNYVAANLGMTQMRESVPFYDEKRNDIVYDTKAFGINDLPYGKTPSYSCMEIKDLVDAIPEGVFDFVAFDACYMGNVEIAYALRKKTRYFISSCYEIVCYGFPYYKSTRDLMYGNLMKFCREYYSYYNSKSGWEQMGGISLVKTEGLDSLASCFRKIVTGCKERMPDLDVSEIQCFDRYRKHVFYDLEDVVSKLGTTKEYLSEFRHQLEKCIPYKNSTPYIFPGMDDGIKVNTYCGLSVYIPLREYDSSGLNNEYRKTEWSIDTGY